MKVTKATASNGHRQALFRIDMVNKLVNDVGVVEVFNNKIVHTDVAHGVVKIALIGFKLKISEAELPALWHIVERLHDIKRRKRFSTIGRPESGDGHACYLAKIGSPLRSLLASVVEIRAINDQCLECRIVERFVVVVVAVAIAIAIVSVSVSVFIFAFIRVVDFALELEVFEKWDSATEIFQKGGERRAVDDVEAETLTTQ
jgi:hypothetical protein